MSKHQAAAIASHLRRVDEGSGDSVQASLLFEGEDAVPSQVSQGRKQPEQVFVQLHERVCNAHIMLFRPWDVAQHKREHCGEIKLAMTEICEQGHSFLEFPYPKRRLVGCPELGRKPPVEVNEGVVAQRLRKQCPPPRLHDPVQPGYS